MMIILLSSHTVTVKRQTFNATARANCNTKMLATIKTHLSPADIICARRFSATKVADMNPATPATIHLNISNGTTDIHCTKQRKMLNFIFFFNCKCLLLILLIFVSGRFKLTTSSAFTTKTILYLRQISYYIEIEKL